MDQAERAVFAVYTGYFEVVDTMSSLFDSPTQAGPTLKIIIKQRLLDGGNNDITYKIINDDVVKKCALLLGADYKSSLRELGITKVIKHLVSSIAKVQEKKGGLKIGSK